MAKQQNVRGQDNQSGVADITAVADRKLARAGVRSHRYVKLVVRATKAPPQVGHVERRAVQIGFAVDHSGSMSGDKLAVAKTAIAEALQQLLIKDSFAVAWFHHSAHLMEPCQRATAQAVAATIAACKLVQTGGDTALHAGWELAADALRQGREPDAVARVLLLTDGQANHGPSDPHQLGHMAAEMRRNGIATSAIGIGDDFNEELLAAMATQGGGNFYYAKRASDLKTFVAAELGEVKEVVAKDVALLVRPSDGVRVEMLSDFAAAWTGRELKIDVGDLVSEQELTLVLRLTLPVQLPAMQSSVEVTATEAGQMVLLPLQEVVFTTASHAENDAQPRNQEVDIAVAQLYAASARLEAVKLNRHGQFPMAVAVLERTAKRIAAYAGSNLPLQQLVKSLFDDAAMMAQRQDEMSLKTMYSGSRNVRSSKRGDGTSIRSTDDKTY